MIFTTKVRVYRDFATKVVFFGFLFQILVFPTFSWLKSCPHKFCSASNLLRTAWLISWSSQILFILNSSQLCWRVETSWDSLSITVSFFGNKYPNWFGFKTSLREKCYKYVFKFLARAQHISAVSIFKFIYERKTQIPCRSACTTTKGKPFKVVNAVVCAISALNLNFLIFYERRLMKAVNVHLDSEVSAILLWNSDPESENLWRRSNKYNMLLCALAFKKEKWYEKYLKLNCSKMLSKKLLCMDQVSCKTNFCTIWDFA